MFKKISIFAIAFSFLVFFGFSFLEVKASTSKVSMIDGASIRTEGIQGLKFQAEFDESTLELERGFFIVFGKASVEQLIEVVNEENPIINGKTVKVANQFDDESTTLSVVLTGIPVGGYNQDITVIGYIKDGSGYTFVPTKVTRSIMQVALNAAQAGDAAAVSGVLTQIENNYYKVAWDSFGDFTIDKPLYEYNLKALEKEFVSDWNKFSGTSWVSLAGMTFWDDAKIGVTSSTDLSGSKIYNFFNDTEMKVKWGWFLDYLIDEAGDVHPNRQATAIKGDGTNGTNKLYNAEHFCFTIYNFFNKANTAGTGYYGANFTNLTKYSFLPNYQKSIYASYDKYEFVKVGNSITLPNAPEKAHYSFVNYSGGLGVGSSITVSTSTKYTPQYTPIQYSVKFFDGENELMSLEKTYTIEAGITLPDYEKDGYTFEGWYEAEELTGNQITSIPTGTTGDKIYYAKTSLNTVEPFTIHYDLDGGHWVYVTRQAMVADFMKDFNAAFSLNLEASGFQAGTYQKNVFTIFTHETYGAKWVWMREYIISVAKAQGHASASSLESNNDTYWRAAIDAFLNKNQFASWPYSANFSSDEAANGFWSLYFAQSEFNYNDIISVLPTPYKEGYTFGGWYDNAEFEGSAVTSVNSVKTLYAKWIAN